MEAVESVWRFVVCGLRSAVGGRKNQWFAACGGRSEESRVGVQEAIGRGGRKLWPWGESFILAVVWQGALLLESGNPVRL